jgi:hypothetical protein
MNMEDLVLLNLNEKWKCDLDFGWIPITSDMDIANTEIYKADYFSENITNISELLKNLFEIVQVYEIQEGGNVTLKELVECDFYYDGLEYIYTDEKFRFVIYCSHENSITVGGKELIDRIHEVWPNYIDCIWTDSIF